MRALATVLTPGSGPSGLGESGRKGGQGPGTGSLACRVQAGAASGDMAEELGGWGRSYWRVRGLGLVGLDTEKPAGHFW